MRREGEGISCLFVELNSQYIVLQLQPELKTPEKAQELDGTVGYPPKVFLLRCISAEWFVEKYNPITFLFSISEEQSNTTNKDYFDLPFLVACRAGDLVNLHSTLHQR